MQQNEYEQNYYINRMGFKSTSKNIRKWRPVSPIRSFILIRTAIIFKIYSVSRSNPKSVSFFL